MGAEMMLSDRSLKKLEGVHPDLVRVVHRAAALYERIDANDNHTFEVFFVTEGVRTYERQKQLFEEGKSKTMRSRHLTGHAVDLAIFEDADNDKVCDAGELSWKFPLYKALAGAMKQAAEECGVPIEWGGDWKNFVDAPHFQLPWKDYP